MSPLHLQIAVAAGTILVNLLGWAVAWGMLRGMVTRAIGEHDRRLGTLESDTKQMDLKLENLRGTLGITSMAASAGGD